MEEWRKKLYEAVDSLSESECRHIIETDTFGAFTENILYNTGRLVGEVLGNVGEVLEDVVTGTTNICSDVWGALFGSPKSTTSMSNTISLSKGEFIKINNCPNSVVSRLLDMSGLDMPNENNRANNTSHPHPKKSAKELLHEKIRQMDGPPK